MQFFIHADNVDKYFEVLNDSKENLKLSAFHEAGHAVIAILLKRKFSYVTINPKDKKNSAGKIASNGRFPAWLTSKKRDKYYIREIKFKLAGWTSELEYFSTYYNLNLLAGDSQKIYLLSSKDEDNTNTDEAGIEIFSNALELTNEDLGKIWDETWDLISDNFGLITEVARQLLLEKKLKYFQIRKIINEVQKQNQKEV